MLVPPRLFVMSSRRASFARSHIQMQRVQQGLLLDQAHIRPEHFWRLEDMPFFALTDIILFGLGEHHSWSSVIITYCMTCGIIPHGRFNRGEVDVKWCTLDLRAAVDIFVKEHITHSVTVMVDSNQRTLGSAS